MFYNRPEKGGKIWNPGKVMFIESENVFIWYAVILPSFHQWDNIVFITFSEKDKHVIFDSRREKIKRETWTEILGKLIFIARPFEIFEQKKLQKIIKEIMSCYKR